MNIIAIGAHADDIELAAGGLLADATQAKHKVKMVIVSNSAYTSFDGSVQRTKEQASKEARTAAKKLGVTDVNILDFPTKNIPYNSTSVETIDSIVSQFEADVVLTHWPHDTHQDHRRVSLATISACRYLNNILFYEPIKPSGRSYQGFHAQAYHPVSEPTMQKKIASLKAHASQYKKYGEAEWIDAIVARNRLHGFELGTSKYAEAFEIMRWTLDFRKALL
ncbi:MAG: hypothetical protein A2666_00550 [Parcubacteria group bacterium RIFCSPHIGHO2_01_FULL_47_10b]|nr:MAG: hypothetical protein A2666_00550 [Parcubacteria group bacterium RIFCSPHIGHO2_01_FULL_47_10b]